jgi:glycosyltransferase involved in cell wall biosynthesis
VTAPRVLLVVKGLDIGGIERVVVDLAIGLAQRGAAPAVAVVNDRRDGLMGLLDAEGVAVHRLGGSDRIGARGAWRLGRLASSRRFDVVHVHGPLPAVVVRVTPRRRRVITTSHTLWGGLHPPVRLAWRLTARRDAASVAVSAVVAASLPRAIAGHTRVIPHGVDPIAIEAARVAAGTRPPRPDVVTAVAVASHRDVKNYPNLLRAVRVARDAGAPVRLLAVGEGPDLEHHRSLARDLGLAEVVAFEVPTPDALGAIASADLLVVASDFEGQPLVVSEALALGRPVVATAVGRVPELVGPSVGRVVPPDDAGSLGIAMAELALDHDLRGAMGAAAQHAGLSWTLPDAVDAHLALYEEIHRECRGG